MDLPALTSRSPSLGDVLALVLSFGWEGVWIIWLGVRHAVWAEALAGLLITILLWRHIGIALWQWRRAAKGPAVAL
ncbi:hypothetical protein [Herbaspirillum sp. YR522]|uniref:hypothetical protein n=1 Tax=Herbaspirillum sp. YR522 TaxID=1144342 RepID=UPI00026FBC05|nr:hypothetical protein [Herbaspirillum sp. YR522]EJN07735.1 hypothetical protein PMI40_01734 [Herbaspirillum sp. YR522]